MASGCALTARKVAQIGVGHPRTGRWPNSSWATVGHLHVNHPETRTSAGFALAHPFVGHFGPPWFSGSGPNPQPLGLGHRASRGRAEGQAGALGPSRLSRAGAEREADDGGQDEGHGQR